MKECAPWSYLVGFHDFDVLPLMSMSANICKATLVF